MVLDLSYAPIRAPSRFDQSASVKTSGPVVAVDDGAERRRQDDALDAGVVRGAQYAQRAVARGHDQLVLVLHHAARERTGDVQSRSDILRRRSSNRRRS